MDYTHPNHAASSSPEKQYKPIGFGEAYDPRSIEGHRNAVMEAKKAPRTQQAHERNGS